MAAFEKCPQCGANLDPSEKCNCQKEKEWYLKIDRLISSMNVYELELAYEKIKEQQLPANQKKYCMEAICNRAEELKSLCHS